MNKCIILVREFEEAAILKKVIADVDSELANMKVFTKMALTENMVCEYIFSTWYMPEFTLDEVKTFFPKLKAIFYAAGTVKQFALPFLLNGVRIFSASAANGISVAEYTVGQILLANKGYFQSQRKYRWPIWRYGYRKIREQASAHAGNFKSIVGLVGCGVIGSKVAELLKQYDIEVKVYDPYLSDEKIISLGVNSVSLDDLFSTCDVISNHLPDIADTKNIINQVLLEKMKVNATLINTGRGAQVDERALARVLRKRKDLTALLDVTRHEPLMPWSRLYWLSNVFISPHIAGSLGREVNRMICYSYECYKAFIEGRVPLGEVELKQLDIKA